MLKWDTTATRLWPVGAAISPWEFSDFSCDESESWNSFPLDKFLSAKKLIIILKETETFFGSKTFLLTPLFDLYFYFYI